MDKIFRRTHAGSDGPGQPAAHPSRSWTWRQALPVLVGGASSLREPQPLDAPAILTALDGRDLSEMLLPADPHPNLQGVEAMIDECRRQREAGTRATWVIVPAGGDAPIGLISVRGLDQSFAMVEITATIAEEFRGTGVFHDASRQLLDCLFGVLGVHRVEARVDIRNARANGALRNLGATQEGVLRRARYRDGRYHDHVMWAIVAEDWAQLRNVHRVSVH